MWGFFDKESVNDIQGNENSSSNRYIVWYKFQFYTHITMYSSRKTHPKG